MKVSKRKVTPRKVATKVKAANTGVKNKPIRLKGTFKDDFNFLIDDYMIMTRIGINEQFHFVISLKKIKKNTAPIIYYNDKYDLLKSVIIHNSYSSIESKKGLLYKINMICQILKVACDGNFLSDNEKCIVAKLNHYQYNHNRGVMSLYPNHKNKSHILEIADCNSLIQLDLSNQKVKELLTSCSKSFENLLTKYTKKLKDSGATWVDNILKKSKVEVFLNLR